MTLHILIITSMFAGAALLLLFQCIWEDRECPWLDKKSDYKTRFQKRFEKEYKP